MIMDQNNWSTQFILASAHLTFANFDLLSAKKKTSVRLLFPVIKFSFAPICYLLSRVPNSSQNSSGYWTQGKCLIYLKKGHDLGKSTMQIQYFSDLNVIIL